MIKHMMTMARIDTINASQPKPLITESQEGIILTTEIEIAVIAS